MAISDGALEVAIHRLRKRHRDAFREEIADTVADPAEVQCEVRYLATVLRRNKRTNGLEPIDQYTSRVDNLTLVEAGDRITATLPIRSSLD
jgi:hypothetical protein